MYLLGPAPIIFAPSARLGSFHAPKNDKPCMFFGKTQSFAKVSRLLYIPVAKERGISQENSEILSKVYQLLKNVAFHKRTRIFFSEILSKVYQLATSS